MISGAANIFKIPELKRRILKPSYSWPFTGWAFIYRRQELMGTH